MSTSPDPLPREGVLQCVGGGDDVDYKQGVGKPGGVFTLIRSTSVPRHVRESY